MEEELDDIMQEFRGYLTGETSIENCSENLSENGQVLFRILWKNT